MSTLADFILYFIIVFLSQPSLKFDMHIQDSCLTLFDKANSMQ